MDEPSVGDQLITDQPRGLDRCGEAEAVRTPAVDRGDDPDRRAGFVEQGPAGRAGGDRRVGLDHVEQRHAIARVDLAVQRAHDADRDRRSAGEVER